MKIEPRQAAAFLRNPGNVRCVLLHGEDEGQIRDRAQSLTRQVAGSLSDPFRIAEFGREGWNQIPAELSALSMLGGRRVVVARDATDAILPFVIAGMAGPGDTLLIVEAPGLGRGKLRNYVEAAAHAVALASYTEEGAVLAATIGAMLAERGLRAEPDVMALLCHTLAADRAVIRGEIEKLALFAAPDKPLDAETISACAGNTATGSGDDAILALTAGDLIRGDAALDAAFADGLNGITLLRMMLAHLQRLHQAKLRIDEGVSPGEAVRAIRPPIFYKNIGLITKTIAGWSADKLLRAIEEARKTEIACKQTGSSTELQVRRFLSTIGRIVQR